MHKVIFYPVKNGDTSQIVLDNGKRLLFDFHHLKLGEDTQEPVIDLKRHLKSELDRENRNYYDVVAFTHGDLDHIARSTEFFELWHEKQYQGEERIKIHELWVPAAMLLEPSTHTQRKSEFVIWRQEARYRLLKGEGIRVFSKPGKLKSFLENNGQTLESRQHLITDAGKVVPGFSIENDGVEFFCHSPFIKHVDEGEDLRNAASLILQVRFEVENRQINYLAIGDSEASILEEIVRITKWHGNEDRLRWHLFNIPHHCSHHALNPEKGEKKTTPLPLVEELLQLGEQEAYIVSSSKPIKNGREAYQQKQPPHIQAKNCYVDYLQQIGGRKFLVTMEEPNIRRPQPLEFQITNSGLHLSSKRYGGNAIISAPTPRAG